MSAGTFLVVLILAVVCLMLLILKLKIHPVLSILFVSIPMAIVLGNSPLEAVDALNSGFGATLSSVGIVVMLGSIIAVAIQDTGASISIANFFMRLVHGKNVELAPSMASFILSIPVFGDITTLLMAPISSTLAHKNKISMAKMAVFICLALNITHCLVPPTPGILAITLEMGAELGMVILWGTLIGLSGFFIVYLLMRKWTDKEMIAPLDTYVLTEEEEKLVNEDLPGTLHALLPLLAPIVLITVASFSKTILSPDSALYQILAFLGEKVIALLIGVFLSLSLVIGRQDRIRQLAHKNDPGLAENASLIECILNSWVKRALQMALLPLLITGMGGAFGKILAAAPAAQDLAEIIAGSGLPAIVIPWLISLVMMCCLGSMTMAQMTATALVLPILPLLNLSPLAAVLAIGAGAIAPNHVNNSGFWVFSGFYNLNAKQALKYITFPSVVTSFVLLALVALVNGVGLLG